MIPFDEVLDCYEEKDEYNQQMTHVIMKNGMKVYFECVGMRIQGQRNEGNLKEEGIIER